MSDEDLQAAERVAAGHRYRADLDRLAIPTVDPNGVPVRDEFVRLAAREARNRILRRMEEVLLRTARPEFRLDTPLRNLGDEIAAQWRIPRRVLFGESPDLEVGPEGAGLRRPAQPEVTLAFVGTLGDEQGRVYSTPGPGRVLWTGTTIAATGPEGAVLTIAGEPFELRALSAESVRGVFRRGLRRPYGGQDPANEGHDMARRCRREVRGALDADVVVSVYDGGSSASVEWEAPRNALGWFRGVRWFRTLRQALAWVRREGLRSEVFR